MSRKISASSNRGVSGTSSRELRRDVYDFRFPPPESSSGRWFDLSSMSSSQESRRNSLSRTSGDRDGRFRNLTKVKAIDVDSEPHASCSTQGSQGFDVFEFSDEDFQKSKKLKKADFDPFEYNSSEELEGIVAPPQRKGSKSGDFVFSEDVDVKKSKKLKKGNLDPFEYNSSEEMEVIVAPPQRKGSESGGFVFSEDVDVKKSKKLKKGNLDPFEFNSSEELKKADIDSYEYNSSEELERIVALQQIKSKEIRLFDFSKNVDNQKPNNLKKANFDPYEYNSSEELERIMALPQRKSKEIGKIGMFDFSEDVDIQQPNELKKADFDPFEYNSSEELDRIVAPPKRKSREIGVFDFSDDGDLWKSKKYKNVGSNSFARSSSQELFGLRIPQSRKHGWNELSSELDGAPVKSKKNDGRKNGALQKKKKKKRESRESDQGYIELTAALMETQESGEMTEHIDEVDLALDGLKRGQPMRIRRASLVSLLSFCKTLQQRRLLWAHGNARKIIDAILEISVDDAPSNLAAAALFYVLTSDGQDEQLLYSPSSVRFLIKLLKPHSSAAPKEKAQPIGSKLLGLCKNASYSHSAKETDSTSTEIMLNVREVLVNCKEMKPVDDSDGGKQEPELNPKWITLLTIEKACSSNISIEGFEDTSRTLQKAKSNFKKKLREFGGLDAVFEVARKCHSVIEEWFEKSPSFVFELKNISGLESLLLLVKCLKIMENATFLSNDNQCHLLGMKGSFGVHQAPRSFTKLTLSVIKILSGVSLLRSSISYGSSLSGGHSSMELSSCESFDQCEQHLISGQPRSTYSRRSNNLILVNRDDSGVGSGTRNGKLRFTNSGITEDTSDPFVFHESDSEPIMWESQSGSMDKSLSQDGRETMVGNTDASDFVPVSQQESNNVEYHHSQETTCSSVVDKDKSNLLADCLLTAVKVLMNLSNDNPEGCRQIASYGGLEILSSLIAGHFPSFSLPLPHLHYARNGSLSSKSSMTINHCSNSPLTDQELDFLVAILGLLVNLVEKDGGNRSRLAAARVSPPHLGGLASEKQINMIPILCSIFLANQGTNEAAGEEKSLSWEDEDSILQGEKEAEKMIVEAYAALLLAFLSMESKKVRNTIAECLPNRNLKILVPVLERFVEFHLTLNVISPETHSAVLEVIESCKML